MFECLEKLPKEQTYLIKGLQLIQKNDGYISNEAIIACSEYFKTPVVEVEGVVSFYAQFKRSKPGKYQVCVCDGTACHIKGAPLVLDWIAADLGIKDGETTEDGMFSLETVACLGCCSLAPVLSVNGNVHGKLDRKAAKKIIKDYRARG
ncbi:MAG: NAD(P)H-dependent oxidoreductase subunit E [Lentisphaeria bacterium]